MATLVLAAAGQAAGAALGLGGFGSVLGKAVGAVGGALIDQSLLGGGGRDRTLEGSRLADLSVQSSNEGASLPRVYGRVRLAGQLIWATEFEEVVTTETQTQGGRGGGGRSSTVTVTTYSYFANFAVALCDGEIARLGRVWADGKLLDTRQITMRVYRGTPDQIVDPLIAAIQQTSPGYRGTAYVVFERLPLEQFGNRLPQLNFEVIRPVEPLESQIRAMTIIPAAGEFVYAPGVVSEVLGPGAQRPLNRHVEAARSDWAESLDELQALCANLKRVSLVVSWFGDDLRAGYCTLRPKVEDKVTTTSGGTWSVAGLNRASAEEVSRVDARPAFGGTPSDASVVAAIQDLNARGLEVMLYPFILMDLPPGNALPDPYGGGEQAAFPWRGRIVPGASIAADAAAFFGSASAHHFTVSSGVVSYSGPAEWSFRRHILHLAALAKAAGGVESIVIGSELRGLTRAHAGGGSYPFVDQLRLLATEVRTLLGGATKISYAADWSEYGAHQVSALELRFPLDPLWAAPEIDFVAIDNYLPLTDLHDSAAGDRGDNPYALEDLRKGIAAGEYFDWYYASQADRETGQRSPITDGAYSKPWVYRAKDLKGWWQSPHHERVNGTELPAATGWAAESKPIRFTELGFPAIDRGANQPNVFVDPKSSETAVPHFSRGARDDTSQRRALEAHLSWWSDSHPDFAAGDNPVSSSYAGPMVDPDGIYLWTWDARPFPAFPVFTDVWADGANWQRGHWLTGRLGGVSVKGLIRAVLQDHGLSQSDFRVQGLGGGLDGYVLSGPVSARDVIEPVLSAFGGLASDRGTHVEFHAPSSSPVLDLGPADIAEQEADDSLVTRTRAQASELAAEVRLGADDIRLDYRRRVAASRRLEGGSVQTDVLDLPAGCAPEVLRLAADARLHRIWAEREKVAFSLGAGQIALEPGDVVRLTGTATAAFDPPLVVRIEAIEDTDRRRVEAVRVARALAPAFDGAQVAGTPFHSGDPSQPVVHFLDLPKLTETDPDDAVRLAVFTDPWPGSVDVLRSASTSGYAPLVSLRAPAVIGQLNAPLSPGPVDVFDQANTVDLQVYTGVLQSRSVIEVLAGANALAVRCQSGGWEILQFRTAELIAPGRYKLSELLRGQRGTEPEMVTGAAVGADAVLLSQERTPLVPVSDEQSGLSLNYRIVPQGRPLDDPAAITISHASTLRAARPLAPVHLRARRGAGGITLSWIRQTRSGGGSWEQEEVPLGEEIEAYEVDILDGGGAVLRTLQAVTTEVFYPAADEVSDFGGPVTALPVSVAQRSRRVGRGDERKVVLNV